MITYSIWTKTSRGVIQSEKNTCFLWCYLPTYTHTQKAYTTENDTSMIQIKIQPDLFRPMFSMMQSINYSRPNLLTTPTKIIWKQHVQSYSKYTSWIFSGMGCHELIELLELVEPCLSMNNYWNRNQRSVLLVLFCNFKVLELQRRHHQSLIYHLVIWYSYGTWPV